MRMLAVAIAIAGCGKGATGKEVEACDRMAKLCGEQVSAGELRECSSQWPEFRQKFGEDTANRFLTCTREAKSCPEVIGCVTGVVGRLGKGFETGFDKMMKDVPTGPTPVHDSDGADDTKPLPAECKRADEVCAEDEPFARDKCRAMVGNLKADAENLKILTDCYASAKNCFAFKNCTTDMWFKLN